MLKLGIRVSTEVVYGKGHFMRCLSIRKYIQGNVIWFIDKENNTIEKNIPKIDKIIYENSSSGYVNLKKFILNKEINSLLIDNFSIDINSLRSIDEKFSIAALIDKDIKIKTNIIICPQPISIKNIPGTKYLCGPKYAPIESNDKYYKENTDYSKLLISFGSYDSKGVTLNVIEAIKNLIVNKGYKFSILITLGKDSPILIKVRSSIKNFSSFKLMVDAKNMKKIYSKYNIAIGAPGLSHLERMYNGIASLLISQNIVHEPLVNKWVSLGVAIKAENSILSIENNLQKLLDNDSLSKSIINKGMTIVDGKGAHRIANEIHKLEYLI
jgi:spore coat polysaccharide biosynthesis predicted glycosyltransferase SpsG